MFIMGLDTLIAATYFRQTLVGEKLLETLPVSSFTPNRKKQQFNV